MCDNFEFACEISLCCCFSKFCHNSFLFNVASGYGNDGYCKILHVFYDMRNKTLLRLSKPDLERKIFYTITF